MSNYLQQCMRKVASKDVRKRSPILKLSLPVTYKHGVVGAPVGRKLRAARQQQSFASGRPRRLQTRAQSLNSTLSVSQNVALIQYHPIIVHGCVSPSTDCTGTGGRGDGGRPASVLVHDSTARAPISGQEHYVGGIGHRACLALPCCVCPVYRQS
jgi:hypothetical protein